MDHLRPASFSVVWLQFGRGGEAAETTRFQGFWLIHSFQLQFGRGGEAAET